MEMWARYAHKALWHDFKPGWALHKSHHEPRFGPFEANDIFAIINAVPAFSLCLYGFLTPTLFGGVCFGAGELDNYIREQDVSLDSMFCAWQKSRCVAGAILS